MLRLLNRFWQLRDRTPLHQRRVLSKKALTARLTGNVSPCSITSAPARLLPEDSGPRANVLPPPLLATAEASAGLVAAATKLLPADVRFTAQLRILAWLSERLPRSRPQVLATLAAIGLGHCAHDVRPSEGIQEVSQTVERVLLRTGIEGATDVLLKSYKRVGVVAAEERSVAVY